MEDISELQVTTTGDDTLRPHKKRSPNACAACRRGHVRCDKRLPICRNCITHACECDYVMKSRKGTKKNRSALPLPRTEPKSDSDTLASSDDSGLLSPDGQRAGLNQMIGRPMGAAPSYYILPTSQHRLLHHMASIAQSIEAGRASNLVIYLEKLPTLLGVASSYDFVMHSLMAWAASHLAFATSSSDALVISRQYRLLSMQGLQGALSTFNEKNMDAVFSASLMLSWQAADPREWATLNKGTSAVIAAMVPYSKKSLFADYLASAQAYTSAPSAPPAALPHSHLTDTDELAALRYIHSALARVAAYCSSTSASPALHREESQIIHNLMAFIDTVAAHVPISDPALRFYLLEPTRSMLYWYPAALAPRARTDPVSMVVLAHLYAISLTVQPVFAGSGAAHFRGLSMAPIEEIHGLLVERHQSAGETMESFEPLSLMHFPLQAVSLFRSRMGLVSGVTNADQSLMAVKYGLDPLVERVNELSFED